MNQNSNQNVNNNYQDINSNNQPLGYLNPTMYAASSTTTNTENTSNNVVVEPNKKNSKLPIIVIILVLAATLVGSLIYESNKKVDNDNLLMNKKILVAYYSRDGENYGFNLSEKVTLDKGNTETMAEIIANYINADLHKIEPMIPYPDDLDELYIQTRKELNDNFYPEIKNDIDLYDYDVIFIGYPIWHQSYPQIIKTFIKNHQEIKEKVIIPFNTHSGAGSAGTYKTLNKLIDGNPEKFLDGLDLNGTKVSTSSDKIKEWLIRIGFDVKK